MEPDFSYTATFSHITHKTVAARAVCPAVSSTVSAVCHGSHDKKRDNEEVHERPTGKKKNFGRRQFFMLLRRTPKQRCGVLGDERTERL
jgi:hypothetical protein